MASITKVPFVDFKAQYKSIGKEIDASIKRVLESGRFILGSEGQSLEKRLASYIGTKYCVTLASGTDALTISLKALGIGKDDGVVVPTNSYPSAFGLALSGVKLQLADVDKNSLNLNLETVKKAVTKDTRAIVAVHLYGNPVDIEPIRKYAKQKGIFLVEDCAQSAGSLLNGERTGSFGDISCFSFYPTKNMGAYGDGGAICTNNKKLYERIRLLRMYGEKGRYNSIFLGHNSRLDEIQAAILKVKLRHLNTWNNKRRRLVRLYKDGLKDLPVTFVEEQKGGRSNFHLLVILAKKRNKLMKYLTEKGVSTGIHYPVCIHNTKTFKSLGEGKDFSVSEKAGRKILSLPLYPEMPTSQLNYVISEIRKFYSKQ